VVKSKTKQPVSKSRTTVNQHKEIQVEEEEGWILSESKF
jgi:hypothetical protein